MTVSTLRGCVKLGMLMDIETKPGKFDRLLTSFFSYYTTSRCRLDQTKQDQNSRSDLLKSRARVHDMLASHDHMLS